MYWLKEKWASILILCLLALGAGARATLYGDLRLSIGMPDTLTYVSSSVPSLFSWEALTGRRLFTTNLLYKLANDPRACKLTATSDPAVGQEARRQIQPCFGDIALLQSVLSILGWCLLAWVSARQLKHTLYRIISVIIILFFGFTPQIAEWDSVLSSESLSLSLLAITLASLMEITFRFTREHTQLVSIPDGILIFMWMLIFTLWVFVRDVHLYAIPVTLLLVAPILFLKRMRRSKILIAVMLLLIGMFIIGLASSQQSPRWQPSLTHVFDQYIFPYPARVEFFRKLGMPTIASGAAYDKWFSAQATKSYPLFLISHPGFVMTTVLERYAYFKSDFIQPYFTAPELKYRPVLITIGEAFHPETNAVYLWDTLLLASLCASALKSRNERVISWTWLSVWIFLYAFVSLFLSYFGDADGIRRHIFPSVELFRLFGWLFLIVHMDLLTESLKERTRT